MDRIPKYPQNISKIPIPCPSKHRSVGVIADTYSKQLYFVPT